MKKLKTENTDMITEDGSLSTDFIKNSGLKLRLFAGSPTLLEIGLLGLMYKTSGDSAIFKLFDDGRSITRVFETQVSTISIVEFLHEKFAQAGMIQSLESDIFTFFDQSNEYFIALANDHLFSETFNLDRSQMIDYLKDGAEAAGDKSFFDMLLKRYEAFM